uniref:Uncharacterized protein n=2 Tax=Meloidogyne TaxID=189290 RepID=A0A6V7VFF1_MELEN|nr:unnamed protein product [Meloidogyne enterolobii]
MLLVILGIVLTILGSVIGSVLYYRHKKSKEIINKDGLSGIPNSSPLMISDLQVPIFICAKKDGCLDMLNQMGYDLRLGMLHLNYDDDISVIPELVKQVLVKEKITYSPASDCRYFCMNKSEGTLHIYTKKIGLVSDVFAPGNDGNYVLMIDETFPKIDEVEDFGISLETQSSSEDLYNFKQPELLDESGCANVNKFYNERLYKTTPGPVS